MLLKTRHDMAKSLAHRWGNCFPNYAYGNQSDYGRVREELEALGECPSPDACEAVLRGFYQDEADKNGPPGTKIVRPWLGVGQCAECQDEDPEEVVHIGGRNLCAGCLMKAMILINP